MEPPVGDISSLIAGAQRGESDCFDRLVDLYADRLYGYFYRLSGSHVHAEDMLQDLFLRLIVAIRSYDHRDRFEAFLFRVAANLNRDRIRRSARRGEVSLSAISGDGCELDGADYEPLDPQAPSPDAVLVQSEELDRVQSAMAKLPVAEREVIVMRHFTDLSFQEIADVMGTPLGTALARAHRGLNKLKVMLAGTGDE